MSKVSYKLEAKSIGKKFFRSWILKDISFELNTGDHLLIKGANGSGKSTLLRIISGQLAPTEGEINLARNHENIHPVEWYQHLAWTGPYVDLHADLTLEEQVKLHFKFKKCTLTSPNDVIGKLNLEKHRKKLLSSFSSGMLQRLKVGLAVFTDSPLLLLDEPGTNLDEDNHKFVLDLVKEDMNKRITVVVSNQPTDFAAFENELTL